MTNFLSFISSIFQSNTGTVERHQFHVNLDDKPKAEVKPGETLFKLQSELGKKIKENREKLIAQRLQEKKHEEKQLESEDDEEEICGEEEESEPDVTESADAADDAAETINKSNEMIDMEAMDSDQNESDDSEQSDSESVNVDLDMTTDVTAKPRKRIISMDDDSDDERSQPNMANGKISQNLKKYLNPFFKFHCNISVPTDAVEGDNPIAENLSESIEIQSTNQAQDESFKTINSHDMSVLESEILQLDNESIVALNKSEAPKLFQDSNEDDEIGESQLMALCSGAFVTQYPGNVSDKCNSHTLTHLSHFSVV